MQQFRKNEKLKVFIQANCQSHALKNIFQKVPRLKQQYEVLEIKPVHLWKDEDKKTIFENIKECDLFLHQPIYEKNFGEFASKNLKSFLKEKAKEISFPNLYFTGYHPQAFYLKDKKGKKVSEPFAYHDKNIFDLYGKGLTGEQIAFEINDHNFYSKEDIELNIEQSLKALNEREKDTDISVSDFISINMKEKKLFHIFNHPTNEMIFELFDRILELMEEKKLTNDEKSLFENEMLGQMRYPIYHSVQNFFNIDEAFEMIRGGNILVWKS